VSSSSNGASAASASVVDSAAVEDTKLGEFTSTMD